MSLLHEIIAVRVDAWQAQSYPCDDYPAIAEFLQFAYEDEQCGQLRYLRKAQFRALEVYWYLRLVEGSPKIPELYERLFPDPQGRLTALGIDLKAFAEAKFNFGGLFDRICTDNAFVRQNQMESLRETLTLDYPSYILALAMGAGKTILTYGQKLLGKWEKDTDSGELVFTGQGIKKVRRTVDYLAKETNLVVVVNTTGTPYFERQALRDVVVWYGLGEGIKDGVLKELAGNIKLFDLDEEHGSLLVSKIVEDFLTTYWDTALPDGSPARLALYFPNIETRDELRPAIEAVLAHRNLSPTVLLAVDAKSTEAVKSEFYRLAHDPHAQHRIVLLVNMGTEGWNCPSLFACGLVRRLAGSNNFVLQAATRCLRQVPGNTTPARVYVSKENEKILERQLEETYGTTLADLNKTQTDRVEEEIRLHKLDLPPLLVKRRVLRFKRKTDIAATNPICLTRPELSAPLAGRLETWSIAEIGGRGKLTRIDSEELNMEPETLDTYTAAGLLAANYHLPMREVLAALRAAYDADDWLPAHHLEALGQQIEAQRRDYEEDWQEIEIAIALIKLDGFRKSKDEKGELLYTARISFEKSRQHLYRLADSFPNTHFAKDKSFHYEGYNFDSKPEADYLEQALNIIAQHAENIKGIWFTGGLTDPSKTDLYAEYLGEDGRWHRYTPDFVIQRIDGKSLIVEIKSDEHQAEIETDRMLAKNGGTPKSKEGRKAVAMSKLADLNPEQLAYNVIFAGNVLPAEALQETRRFVSNSPNDGDSPLAVIHKCR